MNIQYTFATVSSIVIIVIPLQTTITAIIIIRKFFLFFTATTTNNRHFIIACHFFSQVLERFLQFSSYTWSTISHNILNNTENEATHCSSIETVFLSLPNRLRFDKNLTSGGYNNTFSSLFKVNYSIQANNSWYPKHYFTKVWDLSWQSTNSRPQKNQLNWHNQMTDSTMHTCNKVVQSGFKPRSKGH